MIKQQFGDELFELVDTLTPSEKRYIRQLSKQLGDSNTAHVQLFEAILKQPVYNEEKLKKKLRKVVIVEEWMLIKKCLYQYLLNALQNYYQQSAEFEITNNLQKIFILHWKGFYGMAYKMIMKTKDLVKKGNCVTLLPIIKEWENRLEFASYDDSGKECQKDADENNESMLKTVEEALMYQRFMKSIVTNKLDKGNLNPNILDNNTNNASGDSHNLLSKWMIHTSNYHLRRRYKQFQEAYKEANLAFNIYQKSPLLQKQMPYNYVMSVQHCIGSIIETQQWNLLPLILSEIDFFIQKSKSSSANIAMTSIKYVAILRECIYTQQFNRGFKYKATIEQFLIANKKYRNKHIQTSLLLRYLVSIYIVCEQFNDALELFEKAIPVQQKTSDANALILLKLICLFEQKKEAILNEENLGSPVEKSKLSNWEQLIFNLLKACVNNESKLILEDLFKFCFRQLKEIINENVLVELELLEHFNYLAWIESKIKGMPLIKLLKQQGK